MTESLQHRRSRTAFREVATCNWRERVGRQSAIVRSGAVTFAFLPIEPVYCGNIGVFEVPA